MKKRFHCSGTVTFSFTGHVDVDADATMGEARTLVRDSLHDGLFEGSYEIADDAIDLDPKAEEIEWTHP